MPENRRYFKGIRARFGRLHESNGLPSASSANPDSAESHPGVHPAPSVGQQARRGAAWAAFNSLVMRFGNVLVMVLVARIISPAELGVYTLAFVVWVFASSTAGWGLESTIARLDLDTDKLAPTVATLTLGTSILAASWMATFATQIAAFVGSAEAALPIRILAINVALAGITAVPNAQNRRAFRQRVVFNATFAGFLVASLTLFLLVYVLPGAEAFAWSRVAGQVVTMIFVLATLQRFDLPGWAPQYVLPVIRVGLPVGLGLVISQAALNIDYVIIGRHLSATDVGLYVLAFNVALWPSGVLDFSTKEILLPAYSGVRRDGGDLSSALGRALHLVSLIACPIAVFTCVFAQPLIESVYGAQWLDAAAVLRVLAPYGLVLIFITMYDNVLVATGHTLAMLGFQAFKLAVLVPALFLGVRLGGLIGVGLSHLLVLAVIALPLYARVMSRVNGAGLGVFFRGLTIPLVSAVVAAVIASLLTFAIHSALLKVAVALTAGAFVYISLTGPSLLAGLPAGVAEKKVVRGVLTWRLKRSP